MSPRVFGRLSRQLPRLITGVVTLIAALAAPASAQAPAAKAPSKAPAAQAAGLPAPRVIIDRHIAAIGGRSVLMARTSTHATGTVSIPATGMTGSVDVFAAKPDKSLTRITIGGIGAIEEGFDGKIGWTLSPMLGPSLAQGKELEEKKFEADFLGDLHPETRYESMTTVEKTEFEGRPCYKVRLVRTGAGGLEEFEFYDVATGLKAGGISTRESPMGPITGTTSESDYRRFGPLLQATTIKSTAMGVQQVVTLTSVEYDNVDPAVFDAPAAIKALVK